MTSVKIGYTYRHFKGKYYYIKDIAIDSETGEEFVVYQALYDEHKTYIRRLSMFLENIDINRPDNITGQKERFKLIEDLIERKDK